MLLQVFEVLDRPTGEVLSTINFQLRSRKQAGFILSRDWLKLLDVKVSISFCFWAKPFLKSTWLLQSVIVL